ncbi:MAG: TAXI family TRAP transporter solute-binding subunit [Betaproteobacteria bacterium]|nr:TAXI family TRAP transporter solute-binding subunit [Betaproteobacteria bacterium]
MKRLVTACAALTLAGAAHAQVLGIGTAQQGSIGYNMGSAVAKVLLEDGKIQSRVQPYSGSSAVFPLINTGEIDLTVGNTLELQEAYKGEGSYHGRKQPNLRVVGVLFPLRVGFFVRKDSPIKTIADLKGKRVVYGFTAQVTLNRVVDGLLANAGLTAKDIVPVLVPNVVRDADALASGSADAGFFAIGAGKVSEVDKTTGGIRFLPISDDPKAVAAMRKFVPYAYVSKVEPAPQYAGVLGPTDLMAYDYLLLASSHVKDDVVFRITKALFDNKAGLVASFKPFAGFQPREMYKPMPAPYHPGALKFYREEGMAK